MNVLATLLFGLFLLFVGTRSEEDSVPSSSNADGGDAEASGQDLIIEDSFSDDASDVAEEQVVVGPSPDVHPSSVFPRYRDAKLPIGRAIEILIGFKNSGQKTFNVTTIHGSFRYTADPSIVIQNFTAWKGGSIVRSLEHITFQYYFFPDEMLEPKDYHLLVTALYTDEDSVNYTSTFYNGTIYMIEESTPLDFQTFFTYILILGVLGLIGYVVYITFLSKKGFGSGVSFSSLSVGGGLLSTGGGRGIETGTVSTSKNEYLSDSNVSSWKKAKLAKNNKKSPK